MRNRARSEKRVIRPKSFDFELMQARVRHQLAQSSVVDAVNLFATKLRKAVPKKKSGWYGLAVAHIEAGQIVKAKQALENAMRPDPDNLAFVIASSEIDTAMGQHERAITRLKNRLSLSRGNHPYHRVR